MRDTLMALLIAPLRFSLWLLLPALLSACGSAPIQPLALGAAPWKDGETSLYRITDLNGQVAGVGSYTMQAVDNGNGWMIVRNIDAHNDVETLTVTVGDPGLRPSYTLLQRQSDAGTELVETTYAGSQVDMKLTTVQDVTTYERGSIPSDARDQRTLLLLARTLPLDSRYAVRINSFLPVANLLDRVTLNVLKQEDVTVPAGVYSTWKIRLDTGDSETEAWISTDAPYPIVKFVEGRSGGLFELMEFTPGGP